jgi:hypothetical protein
MLLSDYATSNANLLSTAVLKMKASIQLPNGKTLKLVGKGEARVEESVVSFLKKASIK